MVRLVLPVGDRTTNGDRCSCYHFSFPLSQFSHECPRAMCLLIQTKAHDSRLLFRKCPDAPLSTSQVTESLVLAVLVVGPADMKAAPPPPENALERLKVSPESLVCCGWVESPMKTLEEQTALAQAADTLQLLQKMHRWWWSLRHVPHRMVRFVIAPYRCVLVLNRISIEVQTATNSLRCGLDFSIILAFMCQCRAIW